MNLEKNQQIIGRWLLVGVVMLTIQVLLGGITRLTGSGLSMTEWKPIIGMIPPINEYEWQIAFEKYQKIGQFKFLNQDYNLSDFKFIFFWEWLHRNWAHFIAFTFLIPFIYFVLKKMIVKSMIPKLIALFLLGLAQGLIGMIMVASGLNEENVYVNHIKLALHFVSAMVLIIFTLWFACSLLIHEDSHTNNKGCANFSLVIMGLLFMQLTYGAFMAGMKAATVAPTWPSINGDYLPLTLLNESLINHPINIHFIHRLLAYTILILIIFWTKQMIHVSFLIKSNLYKFTPLLLVSLQIILGILSVLYSTESVRNGFGFFEWVAQLHQLVAMLLVMNFVVMYYLLSRKVAN
jgi:heme a synthase